MKLSIPPFASYINARKISNEMILSFQTAKNIALCEQSFLNREKDFHQQRSWDAVYTSARNSCPSKIAPCGLDPPSLFLLAKVAFSVACRHWAPKGKGNGEWCKSQARSERGEEGDTQFPFPGVPRSRPVLLNFSSPFPRWLLTPVMYATFSATTMSDKSVETLSCYRVFF